MREIARQRKEWSEIQNLLNGARRCARDARAGGDVPALDKSLALQRFAQLVAHGRKHGFHDAGITRDNIA